MWREETEVNCRQETGNKGQPHLKDWCFVWPVNPDLLPLWNHSCENVSLLHALRPADRCHNHYRGCKASTLENKLASFWVLCGNDWCSILPWKHSRQHKVTVSPALMWSTTSACLLISLTLKFKLPLWDKLFHEAALILKPETSNGLWPVSWLTAVATHYR